MHWGSYWSSRFGDPEDFLAVWQDKAMFADFRDGARATFDVVSGYEQFYRFVLDGVPSGPPIMGRAGQINQLTGLYESTDTSHALSVVPQGDWPGEEVDVSGQQIHFISGRADRLYAQITAVPTIFSYGDSGQLTSWVLTGLKRFTNTRPYTNWRNWAQLDLSLTNSAGDRTVALKLNGLTICTGTRTGDGSITLTDSGYGVSGSVTVTYTGDVTSGAYVIGRWAERYAIHYRIGADWGGGDFPRTAESYLLDDGHANTFDWRSAALSAGTYKVTVHQRDENTNESTGTTTTAVTLVTPPGAPGTSTYSSGGSGYGTNVILDPQLITSGNWTGLGVLASAVYDATGPDGITNSAATLSELAGVGAHQVVQTGAHLALTSGNTYIYYGIGKFGTRSFAVLSVNVTGATQRNAWFNLSTGAFATVQADLTALTPVNLGNGWYLFGVSFVAGASFNSTVRYSVAQIDGQLNYNGVNGQNIYHYRSQLEEASTAHYPAVISYSASSTGAATYPIYDSAATGQLDLSVVALTGVAGSGTLYNLLPAISSSYTGLRYIVVRAANGGVTEGSLKVLTIEYLNGAVVLPRPPRPGVRQAVTVSGRQITVTVSVDHVEQAGIPATVELYVVATGSAFNYASAQASATIGTTVNGMSITTLSYTHGSNADVDFAVRTVTSGGTQSNNTERYGPVRLTTAVLSDPTFTARGGF